jgi:hypothetical protein
MILFSRFRLHELSPARILNAAGRRITEVPTDITWRYSDLAKRNRERIEEFHDHHRRQRVFIIANGPSLAAMDLSPLKAYPTIGMNRIYMHFPKMGFQTTYYVSINELVLRQFRSEIAHLTMPKFINWNQNNTFWDESNNLFYLKLRLNLADKFSGDIRHPISSGGTVTYVALQVAYFMGFEQVVLIGLDHRFDIKRRPNIVEQRIQARDENHFHPDYFPKGVLWQLPDLHRSELAYAKAREAFESVGRRILDATVNGACRVFEKTDYSSLV